ncbi:hypothetical protein evm_009819 [Chilo suppressalis]|nr:hypothetical protein evm_009819 [Chilo suppressalis]
MAPKKNVGKTPTLEKKTPEKKTPKQKVKKEKTKQKTPTVLKLKIPTASLTLNGNVKNMPSKNNAKKKEKVTKYTKKKSDVAPKFKLKRKLDAVSKLELANEVARAQLQNLPTVLNEITTAPAVKANPPKIAKKRGRPKNLPVEVTDSTVTTVSGPTDSEDAFDTSPKKRKYIRKIPIQVQKKPAVIRKNKVTEKKPNESLKRKMKQTKPTTDLTTAIVATPKQNVVDISDKQVSKTTTVQTKPPRRILIRKGKLDANTSSASNSLKSPSLLEAIEKASQANETLTPNESPKKENVEPCTIDSRKTSMTGTSECLSWTKDISSSSTTTCVTVCSNDFVRIDKKMPILQLTNIDHLHQSQKTSSTKLSTCSESSSSSSCSSRTTPDRGTPNMESHSLDLSSSSVTSNQYRDTNDDNNRRINTALDRLTAKLKHFDSEIINWIGYHDMVTNVDIRQHKIFRLLKEETEVISHCQRLKQVLSDNIEEDTSIDFNSDKHRTEDARDSVIPHNDSQNNISERELTNNVSIVNNNDHEIELKSPPKTVNEKSDDCENNYNSDKYRYSNFEHSNDDEDALSLFAESITGIESSKMNNSKTSVASIPNNGTTCFEEYVPQPLSKRWESNTNKINYVPSKILSENMPSQDNKKPVCEKQTADSTSITKQVEYNQNCLSYSIQNATETNDNTTDSSRHNKSLVDERKNTPRLISSLYKLLPGVKSTVFRGVCFYNLLSSCKSPWCRFPHKNLDHNEIKMRLSRLSEDSFIQEYMLLRSWPVLRRQYWIYFVEECKKRELTRVLVEMAIDFYMKANVKCREDICIKVDVMESTLLYLNAVNLDTCEDLLLYNMQSGSLLCDEFMKIIALTQNFSRFKQVFINLTKFIVDHGRTFNLGVATQILERVCILPNDEALAEALLEVLRHTDRAIFDNSMIRIFEKQLLSLNKDLYDHFMACKEARPERLVMQSFDKSPRVNHEPEPVINTMVHTERERRYTSPDTTNLDNLNKTTDVPPTITRIVDFNRVQGLGVSIQRSFSNPNSPVSDGSFEDSRAKNPVPNFQAWKGQSLFDKLRLQERPPQGPCLRPPLFQRRIRQLPNFGPTVPKFPRRSGPDFF